MDVIAGKSSSISASICYACAAGSITSTTGVAACVSCSPGFYSSVNGSSICSSCDIGTYSTTLVCDSVTLKPLIDDWGTTGMSLCGDIGRVSVY
jgi:hypothetical protein